MNQPDLTFPEALSGNHDRASFSCEDESFNQYFKNQVTQDMKRRMSKCFVAIDKANNDKVAGFYTLSSAGAILSFLPQEVTKGLPRYQMPVFRMGRLAVDKAYGRNGLKIGLGKTLLYDAIDRCMNSDIGGFALIVDAKNDAEDFYKKYGFVNYSRFPRKLILAFPRIQTL